MANKAMADYLSVVTPDVNITLGAAPYEIHPQGILTELGEKNQKVHIGDDLSEERISFSDDTIFLVTLSWETVTESESGTLIDFYYDSTKGNGIQQSFKWAHPDDGYVYVVRFFCSMERARKAHDIYGILNIKFKVLGKVA